MDLTQLANLGEFIGGVAVLVTLIYLAIQVRGNALDERTETHRAFVQDWNRTFLGPFQDPERANLLRRAAGGFESLNDDEKMVASAWLLSTMNLGQEMHTLHLTDRMDPVLAQGLEGGIAAILQMPGAASWWERMGPAYSESFQERVRQLLASDPPAFSDWLPWFVEVKPNELDGGGG